MNLLKLIRNFSIIAHINHGKSTIADRIIEICNKNKVTQNQILDNLPTEKTKGITIKAQAVKLQYSTNYNQHYILNLIDTPGHADFNNEVTKSLFVCEGSLLIIDATQGIQPQTIKHIEQALQQKHKIITIINKIDLIKTTTQLTHIKNKISNTLNIKKHHIIEVSATQGLGINNIINNIIQFFPYPKINQQNNILFQAHIIDIQYVKYQGYLILTKINKGYLTKQITLKFSNNIHKYKIIELGFFTPKKKVCNQLTQGDIGYFITKNKPPLKINNIISIYCRNNLVHITNNTSTNLPLIFINIFPNNRNKFTQLKTAIDKLNSNDPSFSISTINSKLFGLGYKCGFLGILHCDIICERLKSEFQITNLIITETQITYKILLKSQQIIFINSPTQFPLKQNILSTLEPWVTITFHLPQQYSNNIYQVCNYHHGKYIATNTIAKNKINILYQIPLRKINMHFYNQIQNISNGQASFTWKITEYKTVHLNKIDIAINKTIIEELATITPKTETVKQANNLLVKLYHLIQKKLFTITIQAIVNNKIIGTKKITPYKKNVIQKCYGGDVTRKQKLIAKQKKGKKKLLKTNQVHKIKKQILQNINTTSNV